MKNEKNEKFKRLAVNRTNKVIDTIRLIGNLSNKSHYDYSENEVEAIFESIREELDTQYKKFTNSKPKKFRL